MWERLNYKFQKYPARKNVAWKMVELGLRVDQDNKIYCGDLKISDVALANAANVDRRAVKSTVQTILKDEQLSSIFKNLESPPRKSII